MATPSQLSPNQGSEILAHHRRYEDLVEQLPDSSAAWNNLGWAQELLGESDSAISSYEQAMALDPTSATPRRNLATLLVRLGRRDESFPVWHREMSSGAEGRSWVSDMVSRTLESERFGRAGDYGRILSALRWGSSWYPGTSVAGDLRLPVDPPQRYLTEGKLEHDIEQFEYLLAEGVLGDEFRSVVSDYHRALERLRSRQGEDRVLIDPEEDAAIFDVYNRIVHVRETPWVERALSRGWDPAEIERQYLKRPLGLVVIDDFLSAHALRELRQFCLQSTIWSTNRYAHGRLGSFFHDGFNCPLLLQIGEELRAALPRILLERYPLRQVWGFKNAPRLPPASTTHADFAAVNVNFWITPDEANLDPDSGGLVVYDVDAPMSWDFETYNGRSDIIKTFLREEHAQAINIPYRQNRAIIFNSDLFHASAGIEFKPGYENRRINVTLLYGDREGDVHHRGVSRRDPMGTASRAAPAWRSAAFVRLRGPF